MSKDNVTKTLSNVSNNNPGEFLKAINNVNVYIEKIKLLTDDNSENLRKLLSHNKKGVQYKTDGHWVLYQKWDNKGLAVYVPAPYKKKDGTMGTKLNMMFTSHGLVWIVNSLAKRNMHPNDMSQVPNISIDTKTY